MAEMTYSALQEKTYEELEALTYAFTDSGEDTESSWSAEQIAEVMSELDTLTETVSELQTQITDLSTQLSSAVESLKAHGDLNWTTAVGFATPEDVNVTVEADDIQVPTADEVSGAVWSYASRTLTEFPAVDVSGLATSQEVQMIAAGRTLADLATPEDVGGEATDLTEVTEYLAKIFALIARWSLSGNILTAYAADGSTLGTFTLTRDANGKIIGVA